MASMMDFTELGTAVALAAAQSTDMVVMRALYLIECEGMSRQDAADAMGIRYERLCRILRRSGIRGSLRSRSNGHLTPPSRTSPWAWTDEQRATVASLVADELSITNIRKVTGVAVTHHTIWREGLLDAYRAHHAQHLKQSNRGVLHTHGALIREMSVNGATLDEIGQACGVTRERIRQILSRGGCNEPRKRKRRGWKAQALLKRFVADPASTLILELAQITGLPLTIHRAGYRGAVGHGWKAILGDKQVHVQVCNKPLLTSPTAVTMYWRITNTTGGTRIMVIPDGTRYAWMDTDERKGLRGSLYVPVGDVYHWMAMENRPAHTWQPFVKPPPLGNVSVVLKKNYGTERETFAVSR